MLGSRVGRIFQFAAFMRDVPDIAIAAVDLGGRLRDRHVVLLRVFDSVFARNDVPLAPRSDHVQVRRDGFIGQLKPHLIVALAGAAVRQGIAARFQRNFRLPLGKQRPRNRRTQQIFVLVDPPERTSFHR